MYIIWVEIKWNDRVKSYINCLFDYARVIIVIRVTINKLYFVPKWLVSGVVSML